MLAQTMDDGVFTHWICSEHGVMRTAPQASMVPITDDKITESAAAQFQRNLVEVTAKIIEWESMPWIIETAPPPEPLPYGLTATARRAQIHAAFITAGWTPLWSAEEPPMPERTNDVTDRQRVLDEVCRRALRDFVGRKATPALMVEVELTLRRELDEAIRAGNYVLPDGLVLDRIELGFDRRLKVLFKTAAGIRVSENALRTLQKPWDPEAGVFYDEPAETRPRSRFEAVAAEIDNQEKP
jgi:hypothetical protein